MEFKDLKQIIQPLRENFSIDEDKGYVSDQIKERVQSEDLYTWAKGYPLIKEVKVVK